MRLFFRIDRCRASGPIRLRIVGRDEPTAYGNRPLPFGVRARWGRLRLRAYLLGRERVAS